MKSNMQELFNEVFPDYKQKGHFDIDDFVDEVLSKHMFYEEPSKDEMLRMIIKSRAETFCNYHNCYSYARNQFVLLDMAVLADLMNIDESFEKEILIQDATEHDILTFDISKVNSPYYSMLDLISKFSYRRISDKSGNVDYSHYRKILLYLQSFSDKIRGETC